MTPEQMRAIKEALEAVGYHAEKTNDVPDAAKVGVDSTSQGIKRVLTATDQIEFRRRLRSLNDVELWSIFGDQASRRDQGVPVDAYLRAGGATMTAAMAADPLLTKALDSSGASALIRQDLEPVLYELYIRLFPAFERWAKEPANGLVHAYDRQTTFGDAQFMPELGTVTDDTAAYERATTPISILATRRGVSFKGQYATLQGGSGFNPEQLEMRAGLRAMAHKMQKTIFQGNATASGGLTSNEDGAYDVNAFDGLRRTLNTARAKNVNPEAATPENMRAAINDAMVEALQSAGSPRIIFCDPTVKNQFDTQQDANVMYLGQNLVNVGVGVTANTVNTPNGAIPLFVIPGDAIGEYTYSGNTVSDLYLIDESIESLPYLGSDGPQVLEIPPGVSGQLTRLFIIFGMWGHATKAVQFSNKVRVRRP